MKFTKLTSSEQLERLEKDDLIIVKWWDFFVKHTPGAKKIMAYNIHQNKKSHQEIICKMPENHYFNCTKYLEGTSVAEEVYLIEEGDE